MLSSPDKIVPFKSALGTPRNSSATQIIPVPGLSPQAIQGLEASYPGTLTDEMRALLQKTGGLSVSGFGEIDFTGRWHPEEPICVLRPSLTLAVDDEGTRWIGESSRQNGLPGPIWGVLQEPAVAVYVCDDLGSFLDKINDSTRRGHLTKWRRDLRMQAHRIWKHRQALSRESYEVCRQDPGLSGWLAELPIDARIYDLRAPRTARGWPYGLAGPEGRFYRCGRLPIFAVATAPSASRWRTHMAKIAASGEVLCPAVAAAASLAA